MKALFVSAFASCLSEMSEGIPPNGLRHDRPWQKMQRIDCAVAHRQRSFRPAFAHGLCATRISGAKQGQT